MKLAKEKNLTQIVGFLVGKLIGGKAFICMEYMPGERKKLHSLTPV